MDPYRTNKMNKSILEVLSDLLQVGVKDPRVGFVTLNQVRLNRDHTVAEIFWSVMGDEQERVRSFAGLKQARGFLQGKLGRTLGLRQTPELRFVFDDALQEGMKIDGLLAELKGRGEFQDGPRKRLRMTLDDIVPPADLIAGLRRAQTVWVAPHHNPDPDAMGSALALGEALSALGKQVRVLGYPDPPVGLTDLPGFAEVVFRDQADELFAEERPDTLVLVDCHRIDRTGEWEETLARIPVRWTVDHHQITGRRGPEPGWIEARACSCCTLIHQVIQALGRPEPAAADPDPADPDPAGVPAAAEAGAVTGIDAGTDAGPDAEGSAGGDAGTEAQAVDLMTLDMATNLYAGLINDTGGFRFSNTMPLTFELARRLAERGVDVAEVSRTTLHRYRPQGVALLQKVLASFTYHAQGRILTALTTRQMLQETGGSLADTEGFVNIATAVDGVQRVALIKELAPDTWRISLRVRGEGDVQAVAARYGGGGHKQAAGCTVTGTAAEVTAQLVADLQASLDG